jgi:hypothetical protein
MVEFPNMLVLSLPLPKPDPKPNDVVGELDNVGEAEYVGELEYGYASRSFLATVLVLGWPFLVWVVVSKVGWQISAKVARSTARSVMVAKTAAVSSLKKRSD